MPKPKLTRKPRAQKGGASAMGRDAALLPPLPARLLAISSMAQHGGGDKAEEAAAGAADGGEQQQQQEALVAAGGGADSDEDFELPDDVRHARPQSPWYGPASGPRRSGGDVDE